MMNFSLRRGATPQIFAELRVHAYSGGWSWPDSRGTREGMEESPGSTGQGAR